MTILGQDVHARWSAFADLAPLVCAVTGRSLVGTDGGLYVASLTEFRVPDGDVEAGVHELCHWIVATTAERRQPNLGLSVDWCHPGFARMVKAEELAWSLEAYLFGDPTQAEMRACMTPEAMGSGGGSFTTNTRTAELTARAEVAVARATVLRHGELRPDGTEALRREALAAAASYRLPVSSLKALIASAYPDRQRS